MKRPILIKGEIKDVTTIQDLTEVFQAIASMRIAENKDKVLSSTKFFRELWEIYTQLRADPKERITEQAGRTSQKTALLMVGSEQALSGDIDEALIIETLKGYKPGKHDLIVIGSHGATELSQRKVKVAARYALPETQEQLDINEIAKLLAGYEQTTVFYQKYISLAHQEIDRMDLLSAVRTLSEKAENPKEVISSLDYIFEPSLEEVVAFMETVMIEIAISQVVLESRLAQLASRFKAMSEANRKASERRGLLRRTFNRAKRSVSDERAKEIISAMEVSHG